jgi:2-polyprenyl-6-methoxyphenol hydroxylase-like FAD-dependent oxidoreductase
MNLGLEDAWVFAQLLWANRLSEYDRLRRPVDRQVVRRVKLLSRIASADSGFTRFVRTFVFPLVLGNPLLRSRVLATLTGLDHDLPLIRADRRALYAAEAAELARTGHDA